MKATLLCLASTLLISCVFVPQVVTHYDAACQIEARQMVLAAEPLALIPLNGCSDEVCLSLLAGQVLLVPVSAVVSGSIVLVGNTVFWLQKQGDCVEERPQAVATLPA